jgi:hypothetical protein
MFSNGIEYGEFLKRECNSCPFYTPWEEATPEKPVCKIEEQIAWASYTGEEFPYESLEEDGTIACYTCKKKPQTMGETA